MASPSCARQQETKQMWNEKWNSAAALIFDCDGTLVDSMPMFFGTWEVICKRHGLELSFENFLTYAGAAVRAIVVDVLQSQGSELDPDEFLKEKRAISEEVFKTWGFESIPPVVAIVAEAHKRGIPVAVASSGFKAHVEHELESCGLSKFFDIIVTVEDVKHGKPAPDLFLEAARRLGVDPSKQLVVGFEDADLGIESLNKAGCLAVDVRDLEGYPQKSLPVHRRRPVTTSED